MKDTRLNLKFRYNIITTIVYVIGIILIIQLFNLQIIHGKEYRETSNTRLSRESTLKAARGDITDREGTVLVGTTETINLEIYKSKIDNNTLNKTLLKVAEVLNKTNSTYIDEFPITVNPFAFIHNDIEKEKKWKKANKIDENLNAEETFYKFKEKYKIENDNIEETRAIIAIRYQISQQGYSSTKSVVIAQNISQEALHILSEQSDSFPGINIVEAPVRKYEKGTLASHVLGYTSKISDQEYKQEKDNGYTLTDYYGKSGIERTAEKYLKGIDGIKQIDMSVDGTITSQYISDHAKQGASIALTIDASLQQVTEEALRNDIERIRNGTYGKSYDATAGAMVVMNVKTGEILALASYPDYDPSKFTFGIDEETWNTYKDSNMKNRAVQEIYPPGSIYKMVTAVTGLETGVIDSKTKINDTYRYTYYRDYQPTCWKVGGHGYLNVIGAIEHSCNYFFYETGRRTGIDNLARYTKHFGLGRKTGIELLGESTGRLNQRQEGVTWNPGNTIQAAIGQLNNQFTPIQMARYTSMLANGGKPIKPTLIKSIRQYDGTEISSQEYTNYFNEKLGIKTEEDDGITLNPDNLKTVLDGMKSVTGESGGTAYKYFKNFNIEVGGKTGSAQSGKYNEQTKTWEKVHAWFIGFAPFDDPEIAVVVLVENGGSGGYTAEAARDVMAEYFGMNAKEIIEDVTVKPYVEMQN